MVTGCSVLYAYLLLLLLSHFSHVRLCEPTRLPHPWDSPSKNTGVGCHFLLQCMIVKSEKEVAQSCPTPSDPMDCSPPGPSVHGICQARVLELHLKSSGITAARGCVCWVGHERRRYSVFAAVAAAPARREETCLKFLQLLEFSSSLPACALPAMGLVNSAHSETQ